MNPSMEHEDSTRLGGRTQMARTDEARLHEPWCTEHITTDSADWCSDTTVTCGQYVEIIGDVDEFKGLPGITLDGGDNILTPAQARAIAKEITNAADVLEASIKLDPSRRKELADFAGQLLDEQRRVTG